MDIHIKTYRHSGCWPSHCKCTLISRTLTQPVNSTKWVVEHNQRENSSAPWSDRNQKPKMKEGIKPNTNIRTLVTTTNKITITLECSPDSNVQHCIHQKYLTHYNLWNKSFSILHKKSWGNLKITIKKTECNIYCWSMHVARSSPVFCVWPTCHIRVTVRGFMVQSKGLSSSIAASQSNWWSSTFSVAPQAETPDWTDSAQPCGFSPPGALALSGSR